MHASDMIILIDELDCNFRNTCNGKNAFLPIDLNTYLLPDYRKHFKDTMYFAALHLLILRPTRITSHSATFIDNIFNKIN